MNTHAHDDGHRFLEPEKLMEDIHELEEMIEKFSEDLANPASEAAVRMFTRLLGVKRAKLREATE